MLKALRAGQAVGLLPDQVPPQGLGVWAPFFGRDAYTMTLPARLAQQTGARGAACVGRAAARGARLSHPPAALARRRCRATRRPPRCADRTAQMERLVRECPAQYLWGYARYKQPPRRGAAP